MFLFSNTDCLEQLILIIFCSMVFTLIARVALNISRKILAVMPRKLIIVFCRIENVKHEGMILKISHRSQSINLQSISLSINTKE